MSAIGALQAELMTARLALAEIRGRAQGAIEWPDRAYDLDALKAIEEKAGAALAIGRASKEPQAAEKVERSGT